VNRGSKCRLLGREGVNLPRGGQQRQRGRRRTLCDELLDDDVERRSDSSSLLSALLGRTIRGLTILKSGITAICLRNLIFRRDPESGW